MSLHQGARMGIAIGRLLGGLAVASIFLLGPLVEARAGACSAQDVWDALENTFNTAASSQCASANSDPSLWFVVTGLASAVAAAGDAGQSACSSAQGAIDNIKNGLDKAAGSSELKTAFDSVGLGDLLNDAISTANDAMDLANVVSCACVMEAAVAKVVDDLGECIKDFLCDGGELLGSPCTCTAPAPIQANCSPSAAACGSYFSDPNDPACKNIVIRGPAGTTPVRQNDSATGTLVTTGGDSSDGAGHCSPVTFCFCPAPMVGSWQRNDRLSMSNSPDNSFYTFVCECPKDANGNFTKPAGSAGGLANTCVCDNGLPLRPDGTCTPQCNCSCPSNQVVLSKTDSPCSCNCGCPSGQLKVGDKCVASCPDPTQVPLPDGSCCNPMRETSCGQCCPAGQVPDAVTGSCAPVYQPPGQRPAPILNR